MEYQAVTEMAPEQKLLVTEQELSAFAKSNCIPTLFFILPLPNRKSMSDCRINHTDKGRWLKFETDTGKSGWCCPHCGIVHDVRA